LLPFCFDNGYSPNRRLCLDAKKYAPHDPAQSKIQNKANPKNDSSAYGPRDDEGVFAAVPSD